MQIWPLYRTTLCLKHLWHLEGWSQAEAKPCMRLSSVIGGHKFPLRWPRSDICQVCVITAWPFEGFITVYIQLSWRDKQQHYHICFTWTAYRTESSMSDHKRGCWHLYCLFLQNLGTAMSIWLPFIFTALHLMTIWLSSYSIMQFLWWAWLFCIFNNVSLEIKRLSVCLLYPHVCIWQSVYSYQDAFEVLHFSYRAWSRQYRSTRWQQCRSLASFCSTTASLKPCGTGSFCWPPSTWPSRCPTTSASRRTMTPSQLRAPPLSATSWWKCSLLSVSVKQKTWRRGSAPIHPLCHSVLGTFWHQDEDEDDLSCKLESYWCIITTTWICTQTELVIFHLFIFSHCIYNIYQMYDLFHLIEYEYDNTSLGGLKYYLQTLYLQTLFWTSALPMWASQGRWCTRRAPFAFIMPPPGSLWTWWLPCPLTCCMPSTSQWWVHINT